MLELGRNQSRRFWFGLMLAGAALFLAGCAPTLTVTANPGTIKIADTSGITASIKDASGKTPSGGVTLSSSSPGLRGFWQPYADGSTRLESTCRLSPEINLEAARTCQVSFSTVGTKTITATYAGDGQSNAATTGQVTVVVQKGASVTFFPWPQSVGRPTGEPNTALNIPVVVVADYHDCAATCPTPTGSVTISGGGQTCTATLSGGGASCALKFSAEGSYNVTATYSGDDNLTGSSSAASAVTVAVVPQITAALSVPDVITYGQPIPVGVALTWPAATPAPGTNPAYNTVTPSTQVTIGGTYCNVNNWNVTATGATGSCNLPSTNRLGPVTINATYLSTCCRSLKGGSVSVQRTIGKAPSTTAILSFSPTGGFYGQTVAITAQASALGRPTSGSFTVTDGVSSCSVDVPAYSDLALLKGTCSLRFDWLGTKTITATFAGNANVDGSSGSAAYTIYVPTATPTATLTPTPVPTDTPEPAAPPKATACGPGTGHECPP
jgi:hypothetical protein